jgi:hypothetical protein
MDKRYFGADTYVPPIDTPPPNTFTQLVFRFNTQTELNAAIDLVTQFSVPVNDGGPWRLPVMKDVQIQGIKLNGTIDNWRISRWRKELEIWVDGSSTD